MRTASLLIALPLILFSSWAFWPIADGAPAPAVNPRIEPKPVLNDQPAPTAVAKTEPIAVGQPAPRAMPRIEDEKRPAQTVMLRVEEPASAYVGYPCTLTLHLKNATTRVVTNLLLTASFDEGLVHETNARPVELFVAELKAGESKDVPLVLTPKEVAEYGVHLSLTSENGVRADAVAKVKATAFSSSPVTQPEYSHTIGGIYYGQAQSRNGGICVSHLATHYEYRTRISPGAKSEARVDYWEQVTTEIKNEYLPEQVRGLTASGTRLDSKELATRLKKMATVLIFSDHQAIDPFILALFKPDTLILVAPPPKPQLLSLDAEKESARASGETPPKKTK
jgi:hypothetical protein